MKKRLLFSFLALAMLLSAAVVAPSAKVHAYTTTTYFQDFITIPVGTGTATCLFSGWNKGVNSVGAYYSFVTNEGCTTNTGYPINTVHIRHAIRLTKPGVADFISWPAVIHNGESSFISTTSSSGYNGGEIQTIIAVCVDSTGACTYPFLYA